MDESTFQTPSGRRLTFTAQSVRDFINTADCLEEIYYTCCGERCFEEGSNCNNCEHDGNCAYALKNKIIKIYREYMKGQL